MMGQFSGSVNLNIAVPARDKVFFSLQIQARPEYQNSMFHLNFFSDSPLLMRSARFSTAGRYLNTGSMKKSSSHLFYHLNNVDQTIFSENVFGCDELRKYP